MVSLGFLSLFVPLWQENFLLLASPRLLLIMAPLFALFGFKLTFAHFPPESFSEQHGAPLQTGSTPKKAPSHHDRELSFSSFFFPFL